MILTLTEARGVIPDGYELTVLVFSLVFVAVVLIFSRRKGK
jgi:hypothetical protein